MSGDLKYPDGIVGKILFDPIKEGADRLCVLTAEATPSMASWLLKSYEELGISDVAVELIICSTLNKGMDKELHKSFKELHGTRYSDKWGNFSCGYLIHPPALESDNYYIWLNRDKPVRAYTLSGSFTQQYFLHDNKENVNETNAALAYTIYMDAEKRTMYCTHAEVDEYVVFCSSEDNVREQMAADTENCVHLSLLARGGETGTRSGLNWGQRNKRNRNEAYIPLPSHIAKSGFFPLDKQHFLVVTDDHHTLQLRVEQQNDKAITTPDSNALLGEYFRNRLGLSNGAYVRKDDLLAYGRTDVTFYKIDEEQYYMDFSVEEK